jgi:competence protein ComGC
MRAGFSLAELLVTTLLIGACAGAIAGAHATRGHTAEGTACSATARTLSAAMEAYNLDHDTRRTDIERLLPELAREGYAAHGPAGCRYAFNGRNVFCAIHTGAPPPPAPPIEWPALGMPLLALALGALRLASTPRFERVLPVSAPVPATPATGRCAFCHAPLEPHEQALEEEGRVFHDECGRFYRERLVVS